ncbi:MAG: hypothetical protein JST44_16705 [Cyanobacteria bacterium SZAS LIN-5]|nr:hypothetical protein [Cyanobacteria bacterium SZAS LIN-5]
MNDAIECTNSSLEEKPFPESSELLSALATPPTAPPIALLPTLMAIDSTADCATGTPIAMRADSTPLATASEEAPIAAKVIAELAAETARCSQKSRVGSIAGVKTSP